MSYEKPIRCPICKYQKAFCKCVATSPKCDDGGLAEALLERARIDPDAPGEIVVPSSYRLQTISDGQADEDLNRWLHENVIGKCWHANFTDRFHCHKCPPWERGNWEPDPDYCNSLDAVAKVEVKIIEALGGFGRSVYGVKVAQLVNTDNGKMGWAITATARQRAETCKEAWETK